MKHSCTSIEHYRKDRDEIEHRKLRMTEIDIQAIGRLSPRESYDRAFRMRTAFQQSVLHRELPKKQWTTSEQVSCPSHDANKLTVQDGRYLAPIVEQVAKEDKEREMWDNVTVERKK